MKIRRAEPRDVEIILQLIRDLAEYERASGMARATAVQLHSSLFGEQPKVFCDLVETDEGVVAGFAVWFLNFSTWTGSYGIYLEDLFVDPAFRGQGFGKALLRHLAKECVANGYHRLQWSVLDWNTSAIDFYRSLGAEPMDEWTVYRVAHEALEQLAQG